MKKKRLLTDKTNGLEDEFSAEMSRQIQEEIDWEILCELMKMSGWTQIKTSWEMKSLEEMYELKTWCESSLKGHRKGRGNTWLFELEKDAAKFALRWA